MALKATAAILALLTINFVAGAAAQIDPVKSRQTIMKANGTTVGLLLKMSKGDIPFNSAVAKAGFDTFHNTIAIASLFPAGSDQGDATRALPAIWTDTAGFSSALAKLITADEAVLSNPPGNVDSLKAALATIAPGCNGCHSSFRKPNP